MCGSCIWYFLLCSCFLLLFSTSSICITSGLRKQVEKSSICHLPKYLRFCVCISIFEVYFVSLDFLIYTIEGNRLSGQVVKAGTCPLLKPPPPPEWTVSPSLLIFSTNDDEMSTGLCIPEKTFRLTLINQRCWSNNDFFHLP